MEGGFSAVCFRHIAFVIDSLLSFLIGFSLVLLVTFLLALVTCFFNLFELFLQFLVLCSESFSEVAKGDKGSINCVTGSSEYADSFLTARSTFCC